MGVEEDNGQGRSLNLMTNGELMEILLKSAVNFQNDIDVFERNSHMFEELDYRVSDSDKAVVLTAFLNHVAMHNCGMDYGLYLSDFLEKVNKET